MGAILRYFRTHPWHRRLLTVSLTIIVALAAAMLLRPRVRDYLILRDLRSAEEGTRLAAIPVAAARVAERPEFLARLEDALDVPDDAAFTAVAAALDEAGEFYVPRRRGEYVDRFRLHEFQAVGHLPSRLERLLRRRGIVIQALWAGRDNRHVRRLLALAGGDEEARVRESAALLAGRLGDDAILRRLVADDEPRVAAAAAVSAGVGGRDALFDAVVALIDNADAERAAAGAYAAALLRPAEASAPICRRLEAAGDDDLRDRLLHVVTVLHDARSREVVLGMLSAAREAGKYPPAMALVASAFADLPEADRAAFCGDVKAVIAGARRDVWSSAQVMAAIEAADVAGVDVVEELCALWLSETWSAPGGEVAGPLRQDFELMWVHAMGLLGRQAGARPAADPARERAVAVLANVADYYDPRAWQRGFRTMPVASAAAAAALWRLGYPKADALVRDIAGMGERLACDHLAWDVGRGGGERALALGFGMLPALEAPPGQAELNDDVRGTGALLLAFAAETPGQKASAIARVAERLAGGRRGPETNPTVVDMYRCALLMLGQRERVETVREMLRRLPQRRAMTALLVARDQATLDRLLGGIAYRPGEIDGMLTDEGLAEVLAATDPDLPGIDAAAPAGVRAWQARLLQHHYPWYRAGLPGGRDPRRRP